MKYIVIHCAVTTNGSDRFTENDINNWHKERGFLRTEPISETFNPHLKHIGYHFVILADEAGTLVTGRAVGESGAHCPGANGGNEGIGICLMGTNQFLPSQWATLTMLVRTLQAQYDNKLEVRSHASFESARKQRKSCPNFSAEAWWANGGGQYSGHTLA